MSEIKARPTLYRGIQMRSRLEADYAASLDRGEVEWEYEPVCFGGPDGQWLPDFRILRHGSVAYIEVKPRTLPDDQWEAILTRMTVAWLTDPRAYLNLVLWSYGDPARHISFVGLPAHAAQDGITWWSEVGGEPYHPSICMGQHTLLANQISTLIDAAEAGAS